MKKYLAFFALLMLFTLVWFRPGPTQLSTTSFVATIPSPRATDPIPTPTPQSNNSQPETPLALALGSSNEPITDTNLILKTIETIATQENNHILSQNGWLHLSGQLYSFSYLGNIPDNTLYTDSWYLLESGFYQTALDLHYDNNGNELSRAIFSNGYWQQPGIQPPYPAPVGGDPSQPLSLDSANALAEIRQNVVQATKTIGWQEAREGKLFFIVEQHFINTPPLEIVGLAEPIQGGLNRYLFDWQNGLLLQQEYHLQTTSGGWLLVSSRNLVESQFVTELPPDVKAIYEATLLAISTEE